jgi:hypothetical protein
MEPANSDWKEKMLLMNGIINPKREYKKTNALFQERKREGNSRIRKFCKNVSVSANFFFSF